MKLPEVLKKEKLFFRAVFIALIVAVLDLLTKRLVFAALQDISIDQITRNPEIQITSFFSLVRVWNYGVSFGMFNGIENSQIILCSLQGSILVILLFWLFNNQKIHISYALALIIGGALGNLMDRVKNGAVADFLDFYVGSYHWPAFNLADSCIFIGVTILVLEDFIFKSDK